ncbi:hypothetical protein V3W47_01840 [Deinococcus sp. YIM 134068]|uniref:hypothetical protein n=1 Tax=Deinococcus lichenicola TaxID=3118910 RepID=UPI002F933C4D
MKITEHDALLILRPELRDPELERRRLDTLARSEWLYGLTTPEHLQAGIPLPDRPGKVQQR